MRKEGIMPQLVISVKDAAQSLGLSPYTLRNWIKQGKIPSVRLGKRVMIEPSTIQQLLAKGRTQVEGFEPTEAVPPLRAKNQCQ